MDKDGQAAEARQRAEQLRSEAEESARRASQARAEDDPTFGMGTRSTSAQPKEEAAEPTTTDGDDDGRDERNGLDAEPADG
jgi:hypothetical protein